MKVVCRTVGVVVATIVAATTLFITTSSGHQAEAAPPQPNGGVICYTLDEGTGDTTEDQQWLHEIALHPTPNSSTSSFNPTLFAGNAESIAIRNDTAEIYTYEPAAEVMLALDPDTGVPSGASDFNLTGLGDVDAMFFSHDVDGDPTNDVLWVLVDGDYGVDTLWGYQPNGSTTTSPVVLNTGMYTSINGATWLPSTGEFFVTYSAIASAAPSTLASLGSGTSPVSSFTDVALLPVDVEGLGTNGGDRLFATTGEDGPQADTFFEINPSSYVATPLLDLNAGAPVGGGADFESVDCVEPGLALKKTVVTSGQLPNGDFKIKFGFKISNTGFLPLEDITLTDPMGFAAGAVVVGPVPSNSGPSDCSADVLAGAMTLNIGESCKAYWTYVVSVDEGKYRNYAKVTGTPSNGIAEPMFATGATEFKLIN